MGLFSKLFSKKSKKNETDWNDLLQKSIQMDLEFNNSTVRCKKCGSKFIFNDGWQLFQSMAKESAIMNPLHASTVICSDCFSIFKCRCDYKHNKMDLIENVTHEKKELLQEKYL